MTKPDAGTGEPSSVGIGPLYWRWQDWPTPGEARAAESVLQLLRCVGLVWILLQIVVGFASDSPAERAVGVSAVAVLAVGILVLAQVTSQTETRRQAIRLTVGGFTFDAVLLLGAVAAIAATGEPAPWESLLLLVAEGGIRLQLPGAALAWALTMGALVGIPVMAETAPAPVEQLVFRGGLAGIMGLLFGLLSAAQRAARDAAATHLAELERLSSWRSQLLGALAHDLRSPLATAISLAQTLHDRDPDLDAADRQRLSARIATQGERGQRLVEDLLTMAQAEHDHLTIAPRPVDVEDVIRRAVETTGVDAAVAVPPGLHAYADPDRLEQALANLLDNARRHGDPPITVTAARAPEGSIELAVCDHGTGIAAQDRETLFRAFEHGNHADSIGLGLWIVRQIANAHGGHARYRDRTPQGARFEIHLPASPNPTD